MMCYKMRQKMGEADIRQKTWTKAVAGFLKRVMPSSSCSEQASKAPDAPLKRRAAGRRRIKRLRSLAHSFLRLLKNLYQETKMMMMEMITLL